MATTSVHFFVHGLPAPSDSINVRLEEAVKDVNNREDIFPVLKDLNRRGVNQVVVGPHHICFLLDDGTLHRTSYAVECDKSPGKEPVEPILVKTKAGQEPPAKKPHVAIEDTGAGNLPVPASRNLQSSHPHHVYSDPQLQAARRSVARQREERATSGRAVQPAARRAHRRMFAAVTSGSSTSANRARIVTQALNVSLAAAHNAGAPDPGLNRRSGSSSVPVPEELIIQVQTVLQGKSRRAIIRELLRVNLDVNLAVNNLLSRDDDLDGNESDEMPNEDEMLISLMEDAMDPATEAHWTHSGFNRAPGDWSSGASKDRQDRQSSWIPSQPSPYVTIGDNIETFTFSTGEAPPKFVLIGALLSELLCVCENGQLYQWRWDQKLAYSNPTVTNLVDKYHPKADSLGFSHEKIRSLATCSIRASFLTESGKLATLIDDSASMLAKKLEHAAIAFSELQNEKIVELTVCLMYSCVRVESGFLYWWGVMPLGYRHRSWEKSRAKTKKTKANVPGSELQVGSTVVYRNGAVYQPGAIGFRINIWGEVQCGELIDNMWDLSSIARFKLLDAKTGRLWTKTTDISVKSVDSGTQARPSTESATAGKRSADTTEEGPHVIESWQPKDVVIVDEGERSPMVGKITKIADDHAWVTFTRNDPITQQDSAIVQLEEPRYMKRSDLQLYKPQLANLSSKFPDCIQKTPKKLRISAGCKKVLACAPNTKSIQLVVLGVSGKLSFVNYNLQSGKKDSQSRFLSEARYIVGNPEKSIKLITGGRDGMTIMLDGNRCFYPIEKDNTGGLRTPHPLNCSPIPSLSAFIRSVNLPNRTNNRLPCGAVAFVVRKTSLIQSILETEVDKVRAILEGPADVLEQQLRECSDGNRNIFHACVAICAPQPRKDFPRSLSSGRLDPDVKKVEDMLGMIDLPLPGDSSAQAAEYMQHLISRKNVFSPMLRRSERDGGSQSRARGTGVVYHPPFEAPSPAHVPKSQVLVEEVPEAMDTKNSLDQDAGTAGPMSFANAGYVGRMDRARSILNILCSHSALKKIMLELMAAKNSLGMTPFMYAILTRSYEAALLLLNSTVIAIRESFPDFSSRELTTVDEKTVDTLVMEFLYPPQSDPDDSPLFVLCLNDVCTYTWTGARHIQQDVWECRTCGLTGTLCCCTECARTCHRGHDCKIKRSSPTAYCDCWEKCKCQSLVSGNETIRLELFSKLITMSTDLVVRQNSKGEFLLQYLVHTVGRQLEEQRFVKTNRHDDRQDLLNPPKFCQLALTLLLGSFEALKTALMNGYPSPRLASFTSAVQEDQFHLSYQSGTALLDRFIYVLLTKCSTEHIDAFISTVQTTAGDLCEGREVTFEAQEMTSRFIRSIVRVFVVLTGESAQTNSRTRMHSTSKPLLKLRKMFRQLPLSSVVELCEAAEALLAPVRLGIARPTAEFSTMGVYADGPRGSDDLFNLEPLTERRRGRNRRETHAASSSQQQDADSNAAPFEEDFDSDIVIPPDNPRPPQILHGRIRIPVPAAASGSQSAHVASSMEEPNSSTFSASSQAPLDIDPNMSDMDIDDDGDSDGTDSDTGGSPEFGGQLGDQREQQQEGAVQDQFSDGEGDDDDENDDSEHSTGTHDDDEEDDEDEVESDAVDMDDSGSVEGEDDNLYSFFATEGSRGPNAVYVRTSTGGHTIPSTYSSRASGAVSLPQGMQWAVHQNPGRYNHRGSRNIYSQMPSSNRRSYIYMDSFGLIRRSASASEGTTPSFNATFANLARSYAIITREVADLLAELRDQSLRPATVLVVDASRMDRLENYVDECMKRTWSWMCNVMDSTEAQLRFGYALHQSSDAAPVHPSRDRASSSNARDQDHESLRPSHGSHAHVVQRKPPRDTSASSRNDFLSYALSLMRSHNSEHGDSLPVVDVSAMKHVAFVLDAIVYYIRATTDPSTLLDLRKSRIPPSHSNFERISPSTFEEEDLEEMTLGMEVDLIRQSMFPDHQEVHRASRDSGRSQPFFRRSRSMCYLGSAQADPFKRPLSEVLPLADRPQMLLPHARREELFGTKLVDYSSEVPWGCPPNFKSPPVRLSLTNRQEDSRPWMVGDDSDDEYGGEEGAQGEEPMDTGEISEANSRRKILGTYITQDLLLGRWRQTLDLFSRVFADDVANEPGSLLGDIASFPVKESKFRREMERIRSQHPRDLTMDVQRARGDLIPESFAALNAFFNKRVGHSAAMPCTKIKVTFRDEPGEGNGVARSYFTVMAEALLVQEKLPQLDRPAPVPVPVPPHSSADRARWVAHEATTRLRFMRDAAASSNRRSASEGESLAERDARASRTFPDVNAQPFRPSERQPGWSSERTELAEAITQNIAGLRPNFSQPTIQRITGMLMQLDANLVEILLQNEDILNARIDDAAHALVLHRPELLHDSGELLASLSVPLDVSIPPPFAVKLLAPATPIKEEEKPEEKLNDDDSPLFYEPGRPGFYALRAGKNSSARLGAFRNVGRLIGLALLQGEIFPLCLTRSTIKYILDRPRTWSDFAFHDPIMYETLRKLVVDIEAGMTDEELSDMCLYFAVDLPLEEGNKDLELKPHGYETQVTRQNVYEFVRLATEARMTLAAERSLDAVKRGVHDVITQEALELLTPEDFRLMLNGVDRAIDIQQLVSWTNWQDETNDKTQDKTRFKHWFWNTVDKFTNDEKQELLYFWTGSSAMPASEAGFAPLPSITIRPADDAHLPTANTCISRLYIPQYSSKAIMRVKLLLAIKTKNFGFV